MNPDITFGPPVVAALVLSPLITPLPNNSVKDAGTYAIPNLSGIFIQVRTFGDPQLCQVDFNFLNIVGGAAIGTYRVLADSIHQVWTYIPAEALYVQVAVSALGGGNAALNIVVNINGAPTGMTPNRYNPQAGGGIIAQTSAAVAAGDNRVYDLQVTTPGLWVATGLCFIAGVRVSIEQEFTNAAWTVVGDGTEAAKVASTIQAALAAAPTRLRVFNQSASVQTITGSLIPA